MCEKAKITLKSEIISPARCSLPTKKKYQGLVTSCPTMSHQAKMDLKTA